MAVSYLAAQKSTNPIRIGVVRPCSIRTLHPVLFLESSVAISLIYRCEIGNDSVHNSIHTIGTMFFRAVVQFSDLISLTGQLRV